MTATMVAPALSGRVGKRNGAKKVATSATPPWAGWKGSDAGRRIQFIESYCTVPRGVNAGRLVELLPFQKDLIEAIYADGILSAGVSIPRGNAKSATLAMISIAELFLNEWSPDIGIAAVTHSQSARPSGVYGLAKRMIQLNPELNGRARMFTSTAAPQILTDFNDGVMAPIASRDADSLLGLSSSLLVADEFGAAHWDDERWGNMVQSGGKRGGDSRIIGISTPNSKLSAMYSMRSKVRQGLASPSVAWIEHAADEEADPGDRRQWKQANPALGHFLDAAALEADFSDRPKWMFKMMRLGMWIDADGSGWLGEEGPTAWDDTTCTVEMSPTEPTFLGVDKSAYNDCSAVAILQRNGDRWQCAARVFFPDPVIDHAEVREHIRQVCRELHVVAIGFDDRYFVEGAAELEAEGLPMIQVPQTPQRLVPAFSALHRDIIGRNLDHDDDPTLRQHILSAVPALQTNGGFMLAKNKSRHKIDGAVALGIARAVTLGAEPETEYTEEAWKVY